MKTFNHKQAMVFDDCAEANEWEKENDREWIPIGCIDTEVPYRWEGSQAKLELNADLNAYWCDGTVPGSTRDCIIKEWKVVVWKDKNKDNEYELHYAENEQDGNEILERLAATLS
jgi:hypothetical protein